MGGFMTVSRPVLCTATAVSMAAAVIARAAPGVLHPPSIQLEMPRPWEPLKPVAPRWFEAERRSAAGALEATMVVSVEERTSAAEAVRRLAEIESEYPGKRTFLLIGGWPAFERRILVRFRRCAI